MKQLYRVKIATGLEYECIGEEALGIELNHRVVIKCERYLDYATVVEKVGDPIEDEEAFARRRAQQSKGRHIEGQKIPQIMRIATADDDAQAVENDRQSHRAHLQTMERIKAHGLEMKLIHTHYAFDRKLIIFQFSADGRIDFRELLRDLSGLFKVRVELRQVGVRDEASILGGIGTCGRPFCCATFLPSFNSINVKMAKQQGLSLNPQNISGCCGRLKCCLQYEAEIYRELGLEAKKKQQSCGNCNGQCGSCASHAASPVPLAEAFGDDASASETDEAMFDDGGTIVAARKFSVPSASGSDNHGNGKRPPRNQQEGRRDRANGRKNGNGSQNGSSRPQRNPQKHPLPPAGGDVSGKQDEGFQPNSGNRNGGRNGDRRRDRHGNDRRRDNSERAGESRQNHSSSHPEKSGGIGEFGC